MVQFFELPNLLKNFTLELDSFLKFVYLLSRICFYISVVAIPFYILAFFSSLLSILGLSELVELFSGGLGQFIAIAVLPVVVIALEYLLRKKILGVIREGFQKGEFNKAMKYLREKYIHSKEKPDSEHQTAGQGGQNEQNAKRNEREEDLSGFVLSVVSDFVEDVLKSIKIQRLLFAILLALFSNLFVYPLSVLAFLKYIHFDIPLAELGGVVGIFAVAYLLLYYNLYSGARFGWQGENGKAQFGRRGKNRKEIIFDYFSERNETIFEIFDYYKHESPFIFLRLSRKNPHSRKKKKDIFIEMRTHSADFFRSLPTVFGAGQTS
jgi:hypothetical protein